MRRFSAVLCVVFLSLIIANSQTVPPNLLTGYRQGTEKFRDILAYLLRGVGSSDPVQWAKSLQQSVREMRANFQSALQSSTTAKQSFDAELGRLTLQMKSAEDDARKTETAIRQKEATINSKQTEVQQKETRLREAEQSLSGAERALQEAEKKVQDARERCIRRRKRSWWTRIRDAITKPFRKAICWLLDKFTKQIGKAKRTRDDARAQRDRAANALNSARQSLQSTRTELANLQQQLSQQQTRLGNLQQQLANLRAKSAAVDRINQAVKELITHLDSIEVGNEALQKFVNDLSLLDLRTLIDPLQHIGTELTATFPGAAIINLPQLSEAEANTIKANLQQLKNVLPNEPIISDG